MAADFAETVQKFILSPPGQLAAGATLAGSVWKFFDRVDAVLTEKTKFEIAIWLVGINTVDKVPWPETFASVFDRVFGKRHRSLSCFCKSALVTFCISGSGYFVAYFLNTHDSPMWQMITPNPFTLLPIFLLATLSFNALPDYISLLKTRWAIRLLGRFHSIMLWLGIIALDFVLTTVLATFTLLFAVITLEALNNSRGIGSLQAAELRIVVGYLVGWVWFLPTFFTSIWLWLYAVSGMVLKTARRFDIGFQWFNRKFDIEKKPLQAIGLVAGSLVAIIYWGFALTAHLLHK